MRHLGRAGQWTLTASFVERDTGLRIELQALGSSGNNEKRTVADRELICKVTLNDGKGQPVVLLEHRTSSGLLGLKNLPPGENDWEGYLRNWQLSWQNAARQINDLPFPSFVARLNTGVGMLPGATLLGNPMP